MLEKAAAQGDKNKIVPGWLRALYVIPCLIFAVMVMIEMGNLYMYIAEMEAEILDGKYYVILTFLLMLVVYVVVLLICLIPAYLLTTITRKIYERRQPRNTVAANATQTVVSDRNKYQ